MDHWRRRSPSPSSSSPLGALRAPSAALEKAGPATSGSATRRDRFRLAAPALWSQEVPVSLPLLSRCRRAWRAAPEVLPFPPPAANMAVDSAMELLFLDTFKHPSAEVSLRDLIPTLFLELGTLTKNR